VTSGLAYLHGHGIAHRDIRPSNILLFGGGIAKLHDLGIGNSYDDNEIARGPPAYLPPEDLSDAPDDAMIDAVKEDVWALGISMYETAFGRLPGETVEIPGSASGALRELLLGMLARDPGERMSLEEVIGHHFFKDAEEGFSLPGDPAVVPKVEQAAARKVISVCPCDEDYTFEGLVRFHSWPRFWSRCL
jgi:serine/threonine-protein kinase 11